MKKLLLVFSVVLALSAAGFSACNTDAGNGGDAPHVHQFTEEVTKQATCTEEGEIKYTCTVCGETKTESIPASEDYCQLEYYFDNGNGTHCRQCSVCKKFKDIEAHSSDTFCELCGFGLIYEQYADHYGIKGIKEGVKLKNNSLVIPETYCGLPITKIEEGAFRNTNNIEEAILGKNIESIGKDAFFDCRVLKRIIFSENIKEIGEYAFVNCPALTEIHIPNVAVWCGIKFANEYSNPFANAAATMNDNDMYFYLDGEKIEHLIIPQGVKRIEPFAFISCDNIKSVEISDSVTYIGDYSFYLWTKLRSIEIPASVTYIGEAAFMECKGLNAVYISDIGAWCEIEFVSNPLSQAQYLYLNNKLAEHVKIPENTKSISERAFA